MTIFNKKMYIIILFSLIILPLLIFGFWILIPFFLENPKYTILEKNNHFQIRKYDEMTIAKITTVGERYEGLRRGFIPLARYIGAKDREGPKISMTAPVMQQKIINDNWEISFYMPSKFDTDQLPISENNQIKIVTTPSIIMAVITFSGVAKTELLENKFTNLIKWIEEINYEIILGSKPIYSYYNDPSTPGFLRKNEIMIPVEIIASK
jgi:effector-binding domain-containing protein